VPAWSSQGPTAQGRAKPDLVAPGRTLVATRAPGSTVEAQNPDALVGSAYIKGSGTSEATAVTSGAAALVLAAHPGWTPDQVKYALTSTATRIYATPTTAQGAGRLQTQAAVGASVLLAPVQVSTALGTGSLDGSRGQAAPVSVTCPDGVSRVVAGNATTWCAPFDTPTWASSAWTSSAWTSSAWTSSAWTSSAWTSSAWTSSAWTSSAWTSSAWTSSAWTGDSWGTGDPDDFQTAFWGDRPGFGHRVAGEVSELVPDFALGIG
ncbi:MAG: S8 family serine peptidase, partial [Mycobacteriales bacterium]